MRHSNKLCEMSIMHNSRNTKEPNAIRNLSFAFAVAIIKYATVLEAERRYVIARQLLKSGTSVGANIRESQNAESRWDFIHKLKISAKEVEETEYWLLLCQECKYQDCSNLLEEIRVIKKILSKIISSTKRKINQQ